MAIIHKQRVMLDTNAILRYADGNHILYPLVAKAVNILCEADNTLCIAPQNCIEFWNVATHPIDRNGFGMSIQQADAALSTIEQLFQLLPETGAVYSTWRQIVTTFGTSSVQVHDACLVAIMRAKQISHLLTLNTKDFIRYQPAGITVVDSVQIAEL